MDKHDFPSNSLQMSPPRGSKVLALPFPAWPAAATGTRQRLCPPWWVLGHPWVGDARPQPHTGTPSPWQQVGARAGLRGAPAPVVCTRMQGCVCTCACMHTHPWACTRVWGCLHTWVCGCWHRRVGVRAHLHTCAVSTCLHPSASWPPWQCWPQGWPCAFGGGRIGIPVCSWGHRGIPTAHGGSPPLQPPILCLGTASHVRVPRPMSGYHVPCQGTASHVGVPHPIPRYYIPRLGAAGHDRDSPRPGHQQPRGDSPSHPRDTQGCGDGPSAGGREMQPGLLPSAPEPTRHLERIRQACSPPCKPFVEQIPAVTHCNCCKLYKRRVFRSNGSMQSARAVPTCRSAWPRGSRPEPHCVLPFIFSLFFGFCCSGDGEQAGGQGWGEMPAVGRDPLDAGQVAAVAIKDPMEVDTHGVWPWHRAQGAAPRAGYLHICMARGPCGEEPWGPWTPPRN